MGEKETQNPAIIAKVGNGAGTVVVPGRLGWIYVRLHGDDNQLTEAKLGIPLDTASLNDAWVRVKKASPRKASYYAVEEFITSSTGDPAPPMSAHPLDPDAGPHTGTLPEDEVVLDDAAGHDHQGAGDTGKKVTAAKVVNVPAGGIAATDVQGAIDELEGEKISDVEIQEDDVKVTDAIIVNFEGGGGKVADEGGGKVTVDITPGAGAPGDASYVTTEAEAGLSAEKVLGTAVIMQGLAAAKPAAGTAGRIYIETDGSFIVWRDDGAAWDEIARGETGIRLAQLAEKAHASTTGRTADDHHDEAHGAQHQNGGAQEISVAGLSGELADPQPPKAHSLASHSTKAHSELTGVSADQHHKANTTQIAAATATLTITTTIQDIAGCSLSLAAGTWIVWGIFYFRGNKQGCYAIGNLDVGGVDETPLAVYQPNADAAGGASVSQVWRLVLGGTTTVKLQASKSVDIGNFLAYISHTQILAMKSAV